MKTVQLLYKYLNILKIIENKFLLQHNESIINLGHQKLVIHFRRTTVVASSLTYQGFKISKKLKSSKLFYKNIKEHLLLSIPV